MSMRWQSLLSLAESHAGELLVIRFLKRFNIDCEGALHCTVPKGTVILRSTYLRLHTQLI
jgi:hypothetical protein